MKEKSLVRSWIRDTTCNNVRYYSVMDAIAGIVDTRNPRTTGTRESPAKAPVEGRLAAQIENSLRNPTRQDAVGIVC